MQIEDVMRERKFVLDKEVRKVSLLIKYLQKTQTDPIQSNGGSVVPTLLTARFPRSLDNMLIVQFHNCHYIICKKNKKKTS